MSDDPKVIYLQPACNKCEVYFDGGRQWCQDDVWGECEEPGCQRKATKYVIATKDGASR